MNSEFQRIKYYFSNYKLGVPENDLDEFGDLDYVAAFLNKLECFEEPDFYAKVNNTVFIMEHFEFDSTNNSKKGSEYKKDLARVEREIKSMPISEEVKLYTDTINCTNTSKNYIENAINKFNKHYLKIENYKNKLIENKIANKKTIFKICFFIEDVSCLGSLYRSKNDELYPLYLPRCDKFLDLFESCSELDYVISVIENKNCINSFWFLSKNNIKYYRKGQIDIVNIELADMEHNVTGFNFMIPDK